MKNISKILAGIVGVVALVLPISFALAASITIQSLQPGTTVGANSLVTFKVASTDFSPQFYQLTDSFGSASTASVNDIDPGGKFTWSPLVSDVGTHTFTITATTVAGDSAVTNQTITVLPPPSVSITSVSPQGNVLDGATYSFVIKPVGFTNPSYSISDNFGASTASLVTIDSSGKFSWIPDASQDGQHTITIYVYDSLGHSTSIVQTVQVGAGPSLTIQGLTPGSKVPYGQTISFAVGAMNFSPTAYSLTDSFKGTSLENDSISMGGQFVWTPRGSDVGVHVISIKGMLGAYGTSATTTQTITVLDAGTIPATPVTTTTTQAQTPVAPTVTTITTTTAPAIPAPVVTDGYVFKNFIGLGEDTTDGSDVLELQKRLSVLGFYSGKQTGYFGTATETAVKKFQRARHVTVTGFVGSATRAELNK